MCVGVLLECDSCVAFVHLSPCNGAANLCLVYSSSSSSGEKSNDPIVQSDALKLSRSTFREEKGKSALQLVKAQLGSAVP